MSSATKRQSTLSRQDMGVGVLNELLKRAFLKKKMKHLLPKSLFEERRYEEYFYMFDEQQLTIRVKVRLLGVFRRFFGESQITLKLEQPTVRKVIQKLADLLSGEAKRLLVDPELNDPRPNALILVNGKEIGVLKGLETEINEDDEVTLIPVSHGG